MSGEMEAAGAAVTAGLAAGVIEGGGGKAGHAGEVCANCGAALVGDFCHACGQPAHIHRTLAHLFEEALHGLVHFDGKIWRTLPKLFFRPGTLTRDYIHGRRARHTSPLALFLLTVFLMFFAFAFIEPRFGTMDRSDTVEELSADLDEARAELSEQEAKLAAFEVGERAARTVAVEALRKRVAALEGALADAQDEAGASDAAPEAGADADGGEGAQTWQDAWREEVRSGRVSVNFGDEALNKKVLAKLENPDLVLYKLQQTAYKFSWLLVPISLPLVALLFLWRRGATMFDHGVFTLYSLSFASFLAIFLALSAHGPGWLSEAAAALFFALPPHMLFHLKGAYGLSWFSAIWRTLFLLVFSFLALTFFAVGILFIGLLT